MAILNIPLDDDMARALDEAAREVHLAPEDLVRQLIWAHLAARQPEDSYDAQLLRDIQVAFDDVNAGRVFSSEDVEAYFSARRAASLRKLDEETCKSSGLQQP